MVKLFLSFQHKSPPNGDTLKYRMYQTSYATYVPNNALHGRNHSRPSEVGKRKAKQKLPKGHKVDQAGNGIGYQQRIAKSSRKLHKRRMVARMKPR